MRLDSVREVKAEFGGGLGGVVAAGIPVAAYGVTPAGSGDYLLAVRLLEPGLEGSALVEEVTRVARGEVDVRTVGRVVALAGVAEPPWYQGRVRPLRIGASVAHPRVTAGTLGAFVRTTGGAVALLSNSHVLADEGLAGVGDPVLQPGPADGGTAADRVAALAVFAPYDRTGANVVDAAAATLDAGVDADLRGLGDQGDLAGLQPDVTAVRAVAKVGRTTGITRGCVTAFEVDGLQVAFGGGVLRFDDQVEVVGDAGAFSAGGDSGSLVWTVGERLGAALLFAGSERGGPAGSGVTYCNPLARVLTTLGVRLAT